MILAKAFARVFVITASIGGTAQSAPLLSLATTSTSSANPAMRYAAENPQRAFGLSLGLTSHAPSSSGHTPAPKPIPTAPAVVSAAQLAPVPAVSDVARYPIGQASADAFINLGTGPYASEEAVTAGNARPWFESPAVARLYGGTPGVQQQADFRSQVIDRVSRTFNLSGIPLSLTSDPNAPAARSISVVSGTTSPQSPGALGMSQVGGDGFSFIDQAAKSAKDIDQLSWIVAHNVSHELMHSFGVQGGQDGSGQFIDSPIASLGMMTNPDATFSALASSELRAKKLGDRGLSLARSAQILEPAAVPEPTTVLAWGVTALVALFSRRVANTKASSID